MTTGALRDTEQDHDPVAAAVEAERARMFAFLMRLHDEHQSRHNYYSYAAMCLEAEWGKSNFDKAFDRLMQGFDYDRPCVECSTIGRAACATHGWKTPQSSN